MEEDTTRTKILEAVRSGKSVFFTGAAGTGKTILLGEIVRILEEEHVKVAVTAPTGIAASHIDGSTINSALGFGVPLRKGDVRSAVRKNKNFKKVKSLIIDECSMLPGEVFQEIDEALEGRDVQIIVCGDFFQLPPVPSRSNAEFTSDLYAFETLAWKKRFAETSFQVGGCAPLRRSYAGFM